MKKRFGIIVSILLVLLVGCSKEANIPSDDYVKLYSPIIKEIEELIMSKEGVETIPTLELDEVHSGVVDLINSSYDMNKGGLIGYVIEDFIGDDKPELIIATIDAEFHGDDYFGSEILEIYSIVDGKVEAILDAEYWDMLNILKDRTIFLSTPSEDGYQLTLNYKLENGKLVPIDIYKADYDEEQHIMKFFRDDDSSLNTDDFIDMNITVQDFQALILEYTNKLVYFDLKPIVEFEYISGLIENPDGNFHGDVYFDIFEMENPNDFPNIKAYIVNDDQYSVQVVIEAIVEMWNVEIIELSTYESEENGLNYNVDRTLYEVGTLVPKEQIMVQLQIPEHFSNTGISFIDEYGEYRYFVIYESGEDGSLGVSEIYPSVG